MTLWMTQTLVFFFFLDDVGFFFLEPEGTLGHCQEICHWPKMPRNRFSHHAMLLWLSSCCHRVVVVVVDNHAAWPNANADSNKKREREREKKAKIKIKAGMECGLKWS